MPCITGKICESGNQIGKMRYFEGETIRIFLLGPKISFQALSERSDQAGLKFICLKSTIS